MTESSRRTGIHGVRLLHRPGESIAGLEGALRAAESAGAALRFLGSHPATDYPCGKNREDDVEVLVLSPGLAQSVSELEGLRDRVSGAAYLVVASSADGWEDWLQRFTIGFVSAEATAAEWALALKTVAATAGRERLLNGRIETIQRRLDDRVFVERAKGVLARRLGIGEEEAYRRIHTQARRQRRPMREVAQALLDAHSLLEPANGSRGGDEGEAR